jgi:hypothetical protein
MIAEVRKWILAELIKQPQLVLNDDPVEVWEGLVGDQPTLATVGSSVLTSVASKAQSVGVEFMMWSDRQHDNSLARVLVDVARYGSTAAQRLKWWQTLPLGRSIVTSSPLTHLFLTTPPLPGEQWTLAEEAWRIDLVWVVPISAAEAALFRTKGADALDEALSRGDLDPTDLRRASVI